MTSVLSPSQQIWLLIDRLKGAQPGGSHVAKLSQYVDYVRTLPPAMRPPELAQAMCHAFALSVSEYETLVTPMKGRADFDSLVPKSGWLADYLAYTQYTESPTVFHFFASLTVLAALLGRNVYLKKGVYTLYPNLAVILVAPTGKCKKTSAANLAVDFFREVRGTVLADKVTPESLVEGLKDQPEATGLIYAPEFAVFLGKQRYQEGMVPLLTALFDCPNLWHSQTILRGQCQLKNVALSMLGCSTLDWLNTSIPHAAFGGGFMSRLLFVVQEDTERCFPIPPEPDNMLRSKLLFGLRNMQQMRGEYALAADALDFYEDWYRSRHETHPENRLFAGYFERKPDHLLRLGMLLAVGGGTGITRFMLEQSLSILEWVESWLPATFQQIGQNMIGETHHRMLEQLKKRGGALENGKWLRLNANRMGARQFREHVSTLTSARLVEFDPDAKHYYLTPEGWR